MNKLIVIGGIVLFIIIGVVAAILNLTDSANNPAGQSANGANDTFKQIDSCDILTKTVVSEHFGGNVSGTVPVRGGSSNTELLVTTCSLNAVDSKDNDKGTAILLARVALNEIGAGKNKQEFETNKTSSSIDVEGIGEKAYYVPDFNQLYILKGNNSYILSSYKDDVLDGTIDEVRSLALKLKFE